VAVLVGPTAVPGVVVARPLLGVAVAVAALAEPDHHVGEPHHDAAADQRHPRRLAEPIARDRDQHGPHQHERQREAVPNDAAAAYGGSAGGRPAGSQSAPLPSPRRTARSAPRASISASSAAASSGGSRRSAMQSATSRVVMPCSKTASSSAMSVAGG